MTLAQLVGRFVAFKVAASQIQFTGTLGMSRGLGDETTAVETKEEKTEAAEPSNQKYAAKVIPFFNSTNKQYIIRN